MSPLLTALFAATLAVGCALAWIGVRAPRLVAGKLAALGLAALFLPLAWLSLTELLARPKPVRLEWLHARSAEATVLGSSLVEGERIHLWLQPDGTDEPRGYVLPWSQPLAEELQEAGRTAGQQGALLRMRLPFEPGGLDTAEPRFYPAPQPALPTKAEPPSPMILDPA